MVLQVSVGTNTLCNCTEMVVGSEAGLAFKAHGLLSGLESNKEQEEGADVDMVLEVFAFCLRSPGSHQQSEVNYLPRFEKGNFS